MFVVYGDTMQMIGTPISGFYSLVTVGMRNTTIGEVMVTMVP